MDNNYRNPSPVGDGYDDKRHFHGSGEASHTYQNGYSHTNGAGDYEHQSNDASRRRRPKNNRRESRDEKADLEVLLLNDKVESLKRELEAERRQRGDDIKAIQKSMSRMYSDCAALTGRETETVLELDGRVDTLAQRYRQDHNELGALKKRVETMERVAATLRARLEMAEQMQQERQDPKRLSDNPRRSRGSTSIDNPWPCQVIFALSAARPNVFEVDGVAYLKLQSRSTRNKVFFASDASLSFFLGIEGTFSHILRGRKWMPLASHKTSENDEVARITLDRLPTKMRDEKLWTRQWLEEHCVTYDSTGKPHIYIALQNDDLTLAEISNIPATTPKSAPQDIQRRDSPHHEENTRQAPHPNRSSVQASAARAVSAPLLSPPFKPPHTQASYVASAPNSARISTDVPNNEQSTHPAFRTPPGSSSRSRSNSLQLQALPQFTQSQPSRGGTLSPSIEALLQHNPQPGLLPIPAGGTDEASSIAPSSIAGGAGRHSQILMRRQRSTKAAKILGEDVAARERERAQRPQYSARSSARGSIAMSVHQGRAPQVLQEERAKDGRVVSAPLPPNRPATANVLERWESRGKADASVAQDMEEGRLSPRKKKSFGRLVDKLTGRRRESFGSGTAAALR
jgi:hypothetical protein